MTDIVAGMAVSDISGRTGVCLSRWEGGHGDIPIVEVRWDRDGSTTTERCYQVGPLLRCVYCGKVLKETGYGGLYDPDVLDLGNPGTWCEVEDDEHRVAP